MSFPNDWDWIDWTAIAVGAATLVGLAGLAFLLFTFFWTYRKKGMRAKKDFVEPQTYQKLRSSRRGTYYEDLSPIGEKFKVVGWLAPGHTYNRGEVQEDVFRKLLQLLVNPWEPDVLMGYHECQFCPPEDSLDTEAFDRRHRLEHHGLVVVFGRANLFVPADGFIYVAPSMMAHYVDAHGYAPPAAFWEAVLNCPEMGSDAYRQALIVNGPPNDEWVGAVWPGKSSSKAT